jgi:ArsR family transcriptional regulator, lead/cadmium/zinc/bismuth-responsive transcriptional repressor
MALSDIPGNAPADSPDCVLAEHPGERGAPAASRAALERAAGIFRAAGDVSRLRLLELLLEGECCVTEMAETVGAGLSTVSQQLRVLRAEDLVTTRREGKHVYYSLSDHHVVDLLRSVLAHAEEPHHPRRGQTG